MARRHEHKKRIRVKVTGALQERRKIWVRKRYLDDLKDFTAAACPYEPTRFWSPERALIFLLKAEADLNERSKLKDEPCRGKVSQIDEEAWQHLNLLGHDQMKVLQELADEPLGDLLKRAARSADRHPLRPTALRGFRT